MNGSGKLLVYELLSLPAETSFHVALSTTGNLYTDWCGIYNKTIGGVADVMAWNGKATVVGEVKGVSGTQRATRRVYILMDTSERTLFASKRLFCKSWMSSAANIVNHRPVAMNPTDPTRKRRGKKGVSGHLP